MVPGSVSVLVVDDDVRMLRMMHEILGQEGYRVLRASSGADAINVLDGETPDLILLDVMMPDIDGYEICQRIREFSPVPVIMVTARGNDEEKIKGLDAGADDYVAKPFSARELAARVRAVLRRTRRRDRNTRPVFRCRDLLIDFTQHRVCQNGREINLTATEYRLLSYLAQNAGRVVTAGQILGEVWGEEYSGETHLLQVTMARLRQKLNENARNPKYVFTRLGIGYLMLK